MPWTLSNDDSNRFHSVVDQLGQELLLEYLRAIWLARNRLFFDEANLPYVVGHGVGDVKIAPSSGESISASISHHSHLSEPNSLKQETESMTNEHSPLEPHELSSDQGSYCDDFEGDPCYEETENKFSYLSLSPSTNKAKARVVDGTNPQEIEITTPAFNEANFERVERLIKGGMLERLKVDECKLYLRKNCLRLSGNKDVLVQRIKEHLQIINGGGERKYPPSSFVLDCKGDACTGDVVLFEQNVYEMFNIASRSASGPSCGKRTVAGRIVKESYGTAKQQHTFTIEVLWSKGEKPFPPLHPLLIKGRNLYRLKTLRQKWEDEGERQKILTEKHSRGSIAREDREARVQEKVNRKAIVENRVSRKHSVIHHPHAINQEKPAFPSKSSAVSAINQEKPPFPSVVTEQGEKSTSKSSYVDIMLVGGAILGTIANLYMI
ncbi:hypothetical protein AAHE18_19G079200 [Arachis hypogaea]